MTYQIIKYFKKKIQKQVGEYKTYKSALKRFNKELDYGNNIFFKRRFSVTIEGIEELTCSNFLILYAINDAGETEILHSIALQKEEKFFSYTRRKRFPILKYLKSVLIPRLKTKNIYISVIQNKIFFHDLQYNVIDLILCKNKQDALLLNKAMRQLSLDIPLMLEWRFLGDQKRRLIVSKLYDSACAEFSLKRAQICRAKTRN